MTRRSVTDEQYGKLHRKLMELERRIDEGTLDYHTHMGILQAAIEGKIVPLLGAGGVVIQGPISVAVQYPGFETFCRDNITGQRYLFDSDVVKKEWARIFPREAQSYRARVYFGYSELFGEQQPSTRKLLELFKINGYRPATACTLYYARKNCAEAVQIFGPNIIACGTDVTSPQKVLVLDTRPVMQPAGAHMFKVTDLFQPWWPYCYRFALVGEGSPDASLV